MVIRKAEGDVNRTLSQGDRRSRNADPRRPSGPAGPLPGTFGLERGTAPLVRSYREGKRLDHNRSAARPRIATGAPQLAHVRAPAGSWQCWTTAGDWPTSKNARPWLEARFLPAGPCGVVNFGQIPAGLNAEEAEQYRQSTAPRRLRIQYGYCLVPLPSDTRAPAEATRIEACCRSCDSLRRSRLRLKWSGV